jgi:hypothetical protein
MTGIHDHEVGWPSWRKRTHDGMASVGPGKDAFITPRGNPDAREKS